MMNKVAFWLKVEQLAKLRAIQKQLGVPVSESIRRAIDQYLKQRARKR
jgi:Ribbon-helix-helix domain